MREAAHYGHEAWRNCAVFLELELPYSNSNRLLTWGNICYHTVTGTATHLRRPRAPHGHPPEAPPRPASGPANRGSPPLAKPKSSTEPT